MCSTSTLLILAVAALLANAVPSPTLIERAPPTQVPSYKNWLPAQGGCWRDHNQDRALDHSSNSNSQTVQACLDSCESQGFFLAGVEIGRECFCGNTVMDNNRPASASNCDIPCNGDTTQQCGGNSYMNLYVRDNYLFTVGPASPVDNYHDYSRTGCFQEQSGRILKGRPTPEINCDFMTVQKCIDGCAAAGFNTAGLEFGRECYCDNVASPLPFTSKPLDDCKMPCLGDGSQYCGGADRVLIYTKNPCDAFVCPDEDQANFGLDIHFKDGSGNWHCSYPIFPGEDPNDFFCTYGVTTGTLIQDHNAGLCFGSAKANNCAVTRRELEEREPVLQARVDIEAAKLAKLATAASLYPDRDIPQE